MKRIAFPTAFVGILLAALISAAPAGAASMATAGQAATSQAAAELRDGMRKLWEDHIEYTRNYIISALAGLGDTAPIADRLLANQDDIGSAVAQYYGKDAGTRLAALLRAHILIAAQIVKAAKAGDGDGVSSGEATWHQNGEQIADFLAGANPNWSRATLSDMLSKHLDYTTGEVVSRLKGDWAADIAAYDKGHEHMLLFADMLTDGIVKQFPAQFSK